MAALEKLQEYAPVYLDYSKRWQRSLVKINGREVCGDPQLDLSFRASEKHMNGLLEQYFNQLNSAAFSGIVGLAQTASPAYDVPIKHTSKHTDEVYDGKGSQ